MSEKTKNAIAATKRIIEHIDQILMILQEVKTRTINKNISDSIKTVDNGSYDIA